MVSNFIPAFKVTERFVHFQVQLVYPKAEEQKPDPCCRVTNKRLISKGAGFEQRPWTPTVRKGKIGAETASPGPACVKLPDLVGGTGKNSRIPAAPKYKLGQKHLFKYESYGPGPAQYNVAGLGVKGKVILPDVKIRSRPNPKSTFKTPGPGEYDVYAAAQFLLPRSPDFKIGRRPHADKAFNTPAPNVYKIPAIMGGNKEGTIKSAPSFSIVGRQKHSLPASHFYPGPGTYDSKYQFVKKNNPYYKIGIKHKDLSDNLLIPGPGAYCPEKIMITRRSVPAPSFSIRHSRYAGIQKAHLIPAHLEKSVVQCIPN